MNIRFWLAGFVVIVLGFPATNCLAREPESEPILGRSEVIGVLLVTTIVEESEQIDPPAQPILGPAEPIGHLILVGSVFEETTEEPMPSALSLEFDIVEDAPKLGEPVLLSTLIPAELGMIILPQPAPQVQPVHPDEIQQRLREAAQMLAASGLVDESREIHKVIARVEQQHYERLLLGKKEAELIVLQAEVDRLRQSIGRSAAVPQVALSIKFIETDSNLGLTSELPAEPHLNELEKPQKISGIFEDEEARQLIEDAIKNGSGKVVSEPKMTVLSGRTGRFQSGNQETNSRVAQAGGTTPEAMSTSVDVTAEVVEGNQIRLMLNAALKEPTTTGSSNRRVQTNVQLQPRQTLILRGLTSVSTELIVAVSAEIVQPTPFEIRSLPYYRNRQTPTPLDSVYDTETSTLPSESLEPIPATTPTVK